MANYYDVDKAIYWWARSALAGARARSKEKGLPCEITLADVRRLAQATEFCPLYGTRLVYARGRAGNFADSPSLDRIDNDHGYTVENTWVISHYANTCKRNKNLAQLMSERGRVYTEANLQIIVQALLQGVAIDMVAAFGFQPIEDPAPVDPVEPAKVAA